MRKRIPTPACWLAGALLLTTAGAAQAQTTFTYTGANQTYTVPAGVTSIQVEAVGGTGGVYSGATNYAYGARVRATLPVTPGEVLTVVVGGRGQNGATNTTSFNGGGSGFGTYAGGGGGATDLRRPYSASTSTGDYLTSRNALLVAGGGGGSDDIYASGGAGGTPTGGDATAIVSPSTTPAVATGSGATQTAPGSNGVPATNGTNGTGGNGQYDGGGGGGGYYGGAGGVGSMNSYIGGGGGSSWVLATGTGVSYALATAAGNGSLVISLLPALFAISPTSGPVGTVVTITGTNVTGLTGVSFNGVAAATFAATSATTATATVPAGATTGPVTLTAAAGTAIGPAFTVTPLLTVPDVDTSLPPTVLSTSATLGGVVNSDGGSPVTERGIVYSPGATPPPTIANLKVPMGTGLGSFAGTIGGLLPNQTYTARAYATNAVGTGYGSLVMTFVTLQGLATATPQAAGVALFPNPARSSATLTATGLPATARTVEATLLDAVGRPVRRLTVPATAGAATATVPTAGLAAGLYLLRLEAQDAQGVGLGALPVQRLAVE